VLFQTDIAKFLMSACGVIPDDSLAATVRNLIIGHNLFLNFGILCSVARKSNHC